MGWWHVMPDKVTPEVRSRIMSHVRSKNTGVEVALRRALWAAGVRGWRCNDRSVFGAPDLSWRRRHLAVFVDSAWWHGHPSRWTPGRLPERWDSKIERNRQRDLAVNEQLESLGWTVVRIWDFELQAAPDECVNRVKSALARATVHTRDGSRGKPLRVAAPPSL